MELDWTRPGNIRIQPLPDGSNGHMKAKGKWVAQRQSGEKREPGWMLWTDAKKVVKT